MVERTIAWLTRSNRRGKKLHPLPRNVTRNNFNWPTTGSRRSTCARTFPPSALPTASPAPRSDRRPPRPPRGTEPQPTAATIGPQTGEKKGTTPAVASQMLGLKLAAPTGQRGGVPPATNTQRAPSERRLVQQAPSGSSSGSFTFVEGHARESGASCSPAALNWRRLRWVVRRVGWWPARMVAARFGSWTCRVSGRRRWCGGANVLGRVPRRPVRWGCSPSRTSRWLNPALCLPAGRVCGRWSRSVVSTPRSAGWLVNCPLRGGPCGPAFNRFCRRRLSCVRDRVAFRGLNQTTLWGSG